MSNKEEKKDILLSHFDIPAEANEILSRWSIASGLSPSEIVKQLIFDNCPAYIHQEFFDLKDANSVGVKDISNDIEALSLLKDYFAEYGHIVFPTKEVYKNKKLGEYMIDIRTRYKRNKLPNRIIDELNKLNIHWSSVDNNWMYKFSLLKKYYIENQHTNLKMRDIYEGERLGAWLYHQKRLYADRNTINNPLNEERIILLEGLNIDWEIMDVQTSCRNAADTRSIKTKKKIDSISIKSFSDEEKREFLLKYFDDFGHISPKSNEVFHGFPIGQFIWNVRYVYSSGKLTSDQIIFYNSLGIVWDWNEYVWTKNFSYVKEYYEQNGHSQIPQGYIRDGYKVGVWLQTQKRRYKQPHKFVPLTDTQIKLLESVGVEWNYKQEIFKKYLDVLLPFYEEYGKIDNTIADKNVQYIIRYMSQKRWTGKCSKEEITALDSINFLWLQKGKSYQWARKIDSSLQ